MFHAYISECGQASVNIKCILDTILFGLRLLLQNFTNVKKKKKFVGAMRRTTSNQVIII